MTLDLVTANPLASLEAQGRITPTHLNLSGLALSFDETEQVAMYLGKVNRCSAWWIGDLFAYAEERFGEEYAQLEAATGLHADTVTRYAGLAARIPPERRVEILDVAHHQAVQHYAPEIQERMLTIAAEKEWSSTTLKNELARVIGTSRGKSTVKQPAETVLNQISVDSDVASESTGTSTRTAWFVRIGPFDDYEVANVYAEGLRDAVQNNVDVRLEREDR